MAWAALIFQLSGAAFGGSFTAWLLRALLDFLHITVSPATFATLHFYVRKLAHLTEYAIFSTFLYASFENGRLIGWRFQTALRSVLISCVYALADEFRQSFVGGRTASLVDCGIDTLGASLGMLATYSNHRLVQAKSRTPAAARESNEER